MIKIKILRITVFFLLLSVFFSACFKGNDSTRVYNDTKGLTVCVTSSQWYLTRNNIGGGNVKLKISGSTNGNKLTVRTYGDGVIFDEDVKLDSNNNFNADYLISFTPISVPNDEFQQSTLIKAYKGTDTLVVKLTSGDLKY